MSELSHRNRTYKELGTVLLAAIGNKQTQASLAQQIYVSRVAVHNWLTGKRRPQPGTLGLLAAELKLSPEYLAHLARYDSDPDALDKVLNAYKDRRSASSKIRRIAYDL
jgi:transcriptional regulator with XRE-family HTH domain